MTVLCKVKENDYVIPSYHPHIIDPMTFPNTITPSKRTCTHLAPAGAAAAGAAVASASSTTTREWQAARIMAVSAVAVITSPSFGKAARAGAVEVEEEGAGGDM